MKLRQSALLARAKANARPVRDRIVKSLQRTDTKTAGLERTWHFVRYWITALKCPLIWWVLAGLWVLTIGTIILNPQFAQTYDILDTSAQWKEIAGNGVDPTALLRNLGWLLITAIGLPLLIWRTIVAAKQAKTGVQQIKIAREGQSADRYAKAAAMLSEDSLPVREAGIFALRELAIAEPEDYYFPVQDLLCSFMRDVGQQDRKKAGMNRAKPDADTEAATTQEVLELPDCRSDVTTALRAFSDLRTESNMKMEEERKWRPNLQEANFNAFPGHSNPINLQRAELDSAQLMSADLNNANLQNADLYSAQLQYAELNYARLQRANLNNAGLQYAMLYRAQLQYSHLSSAQLQGADLTKAQLEETIFKYAQLEDTDLYLAQLKSADLRNSYFQTNNLKAAGDLTDAKLSPPVWKQSEWPEGYQPTEVLGKASESGYFTFVRAEPVSSDGN